ncbi:MAG: hypothetical protein US18_C0001G0016 [Parcubacteria group bacterium GW2011_GWB1_36_5]|nr:MAG: hypothetical protein US12_C0032G0002 [Parcubacteria group bacterium GW2011_GWA2_36_24]KKQ08196.1 MAG: hypothetical protein US18_C0001G0016 [Parcubacteria group bacterium GW2011_GWB1_36_5]
MKKIGTFFGPKLRKALEQDKEFRDSKMLHFANELANFAIEVVLLGHGCIPDSDLDCCAVDQREAIVARDLFDKVRRRTTRVTVQLETGFVNASISVRISFIGEKSHVLLTMFGGADSQGVRLLKIESIPELSISERSWSDCHLIKSHDPAR